MQLRTDTANRLYCVLGLWVLVAAVWVTLLTLAGAPGDWSPERRAIALVVTFALALQLGVILTSLRRLRQARAS